MTGHGGLLACSASCNVRRSTLVYVDVAASTVRHHTPWPIDDNWTLGSYCDVPRHCLTAWAETDDSVESDDYASAASQYLNVRQMRMLPVFSLNR
jgi:hypothetical protein